MTIGAPAALPRLTPPSGDGMSRRGLLRAGLGLAGAGGLMLSGTSAYAAMEAGNNLIVTNYRLTPPGWPAGRRLTITAIADLHAGGPNMGLARVRQVIDTGNALGSDLVVVLGDYFATHRFVTERVPNDAWAEEIGRLRAPLGVYSILGNHDWWYDIKGVRKALGRVHVPLMENDAVLLGEAGRRFWLAGLGDQLAHFVGPGRFRGVDDLAGTLKKIKSDDPVVLLVHEPDVFTQVPERVSLTIAGHTHGGQIRLPFVPPLWTPSAYGARFAYGHIVEQNRHLIVSGGIGCSQLPLRLGVPPEILHITLGV